MMSTHIQVFRFEDMVYEGRKTPFKDPNPSCADSPPDCHDNIHSESVRLFGGEIRDFDIKDQAERKKVPDKRRM